VSAGIRTAGGLRHQPRLLWSALRKFDADEGFFLAAGIAFNILLSVIPLILLVLSLLGTYLYSDVEVAEHIADYFRGLFPTMDPRIMRNLMALVQTRTSAGVIAVAGLAWTASMLFSSLRISLNRIFGAGRHRGTLRGWAVDLLMVLVAGSTLMASMLLTSGIGLVQRSSVALPLDFGPFLMVVFKYVLPLLFTFLMSVFVYKIVPDRKTSTAPVLKAALFTGICWEGAKQLFGWYVMHAGTYTLVYGSLSTVAVFFLWVYYSAAIFLLGAEVAYVLDPRDAGENAAPGGA
jgi:membrane protein